MSEYALLRGVVDYDEQLEQYPDHKFRLVKNVLPNLVDEILNDPGLIKITFGEHEEIPYRKTCEVEITVVTDKKVKADIDARLRDAKREGMREIMDVIESHLGTPWEPQCSASWGVQCVHRAAESRMAKGVS